jgi:hypothetical protein
VRVCDHRICCAQAQRPRGVPLEQESTPLRRIVVIDDMRGPGDPARPQSAAHPHPDARIRLEISDIVRTPSALGYEPERVTFSAIADGRNVLTMTQIT